MDLADGTGPTQILLLILLLGGYDAHRANIWPIFSGEELRKPGGGFPNIRNVVQSACPLDTIRPPLSFVFYTPFLHPPADSIHAS